MSFADDVVAFLPALQRAANTRLRGDERFDLVQDVVLAALAHEDQFTPGTNLQGWLFTILRNKFLEMMRRNRLRGTVNLDDIIPPAISGGQEDAVFLKEVETAMSKLTRRKQRAPWRPWWTVKATIEPPFFMAPQPAP